MFKRFFVLLALLSLTLAAFPSGALAEEGNLIKNPGFEAIKGVLPEHWKASAWVDDEYAVKIEPDDEIFREGGRSIRIEALVENDARVTQVIDVEPESFYLITGWIRGEGIGVDTVGGTLSVLNTFSHSPEVMDTFGDWSYIEWYIKTGSGQKKLELMARLGFYSSNNTGTVWFDDLSMVKVDGLPAGVIADNAETQPPQQLSDDTTQKDPLQSILGIAMLASVAFMLLFSGVIKRMAEHDEREKLSDESIYSLDMKFLIVLGIGALTRLILAYVTPGHDVDINCFTLWGLRFAETGPLGFYTADYFCDYPPGAIWLVGIFGGIIRLLGLDSSSSAAHMIIRFPAIICDLISAYIIYRWATKNIGRRWALLLSLLFIFNPAIILNSSAWGQLDSVLTLLIVLSFALAQSGKLKYAAPVFICAALIKPQALVMAPLVLCVLIKSLLDNTDKDRYKNALLGLAYTVGTVLAISILFWIPTGDPLWLFKLFSSTMGSYPYATINAANIFAVLGGNWIEQSTPFLGLTFEMWGNIFLVLTVAVSALLYFKSKGKESLMLVSAFLFAGLFVFGPRMHERYMYPALILLLLAYVQYKDKRILWVFAGFSITQYLNTQYALVQIHIPRYDIFFMLIGVANVLIFIYMCHVVWRVLIKRVIRPLPHGAMREGEARAKADEARHSSLFGERTRAKLGRWDALIMAVLMFVYGAIAFVNLGDTKAVQNYFRPSETGVSAVVEFKSPQDIRTVAYYMGLGSGNVDVVSGEVTLTSITFGGSDIFKWHFDDVYAYSTECIEFETTSPGTSIYEVAFLDMNGEVIPATAYTLTANVPDASAMFDEQELVPDRPSYMNSMYFDEIYHARTAYEHINRIEPYEITHPPLGKLIISIGIRLFGMTPFGWRIAGTVFGILMVPLIYLFAHRIFKKTLYASMVALLFTFDLMHFAQTRIATIDVYGVFFIILMYYFMYIYTQMNFHRDKLWKTLIPLTLCGISFGLGCASKWICVYAGIGLAVLFFHSLYHRIREGAYARKMSGSGNESLDAIAKNANRRTIVTLFSCVLIFIIIPIGIYAASYYPYMVAGRGHGIEVIWDNQKYMLNYHSGLVDNHPFKSPWYEWPLMIRPIWYFMGTHLPQGIVSSLNGMGNPIIWWAAFAAFLWMAYKAMQGRKVHDSQLFIAIGLASQFVPWVLVPRSMFIYHYFASLPFMIVILVYALKQMWESGSKARKGVVIGFLALAVIAFIVFYPMVSGMEVSGSYAKLLRWLPIWTLFAS